MNKLLTIDEAVAVFTEECTKAGLTNSDLDAAFNAWLDDCERRERENRQR